MRVGRGVPSAASTVGIIGRHCARCRHTAEPVNRPSPALADCPSRSTKLRHRLLAAAACRRVCTSRARWAPAHARKRARARAYLLVGHCGALRVLSPPSSSPMNVKPISKSATVAWSLGRRCSSALGCSPRARWRERMPSRPPPSTYWGSGSLETQGHRSCEVNRRFICSGAPSTLRCSLAY